MENEDQTALSKGKRRELSPAAAKREIRFGSPADLIFMEPQFLLDERVEVVTDTALPFVKSEQQDAIEIREFCLPSGYDYYSGGLRITYRPGEGEAAIERVLPVDWYAPGGIYQF